MSSTKESVLSDESGLVAGDPRAEGRPTGADGWNLPAEKALGSAIVVSEDPPACAESDSIREASSSLPFRCARRHVDERLVHDLPSPSAIEARARGVDVLLAPTVNMSHAPQRSWLRCSRKTRAERAHSCGYVRGVQRPAWQRHQAFVANDSKRRGGPTTRSSPKRAQGALFAPFEACVAEADVAL